MKKLEEMLPGGSCDIYNMVLCNIDETKEMNFCIKVAQDHILETFNPHRTVEHQMKVFQYLQKHDIPTYTDLRINKEKQMLFAPFIGNQANHFCFSSNNNSYAKKKLVEEYKGIEGKEVSNLDGFVAKVNSMMDSMQRAAVQVNEDAYLFDYNANGGELDIIIGDFHDILIPKADTNVSDEEKMDIRMHNKNKLEHAYYCLWDDNVIKKALYDTLYHMLWDL